VLATEEQGKYSMAYNVTFIIVYCETLSVA